MADGCFMLTDDTPLIAKRSEEIKSAEYFKEYVYHFYGINLTITDKMNRGGIILDYGKNADPHHKSPVGAYKIDCSDQMVYVMSESPEGLFYGIQTLIQLLPTAPNRLLEIPAVVIEDKPQFEYRGMHLDVVRHIFPVSFIKRYLDYMAYHKLNYFHWHLTDDQGWRFESEKYPELNSKGSWREGSIEGIFPGTGFDSTRYGGFYTKAEIREIIQYAKERYITIIPEIDIPGHNMAVISVFPQFSTTPDIPKSPATTWGIYNRQNNVLAPSEELFKFLDDIFGELLELFPDSPYIHIGGDECAHKWWKESPATQQFIKDHDLKDEGGLQRYFIERVYNIVKSRGRDVIAWDDIIDDDALTGDIIVMNWRNIKGAITAAESGHRVIMTPSRQSYFNIQQRADETRLAHRHAPVLLKNVYEFNPLPDTLSTEARALIIGGQGCMWTEYFATEEEIEYGIFPRMSAMSETYWSSPDRRDWDNFYDKLHKQYQRYRLWRVSFFDIFKEE